MAGKRESNMRTYSRAEKERQEKAENLLSTKKSGRTSAFPACKSKGTLTKAVKKVLSPLTNSSRKRDKAVQELMYLVK